MPDLSTTNVLCYKGYFASIQLSPGDDLFFGKIISIDDSVTFEGCTVEEIKKAFHEAVDDYLKTCKQLGKSVSPNIKFTMGIVVDKSIRDHGNDQAIQERAQKAIAFLKKHGAPKSFSKNK